LGGGKERENSPENLRRVLSKFIYRFLTFNLSLLYHIVISSATTGPLIALLAAFMSEGQGGISLGDFLNGKVFAGSEAHKLMPDKNDTARFAQFMVRHKKGLAVEKAAVEYI